MTVHVSLKRHWMLQHVLPGCQIRFVIIHHRETVDPVRKRENVRGRNEIHEPRSIQLDEFEAERFEIGGRHQLESPKVIGDDGFMTEEAGAFQGLDRFECRKAVVEALEKEGLLINIEPHPHSIGHCYRCKTIVEPNLSKQWFVSAKPLAEKAIAAVENGDTRIIPDTWVKTYYDWMKNIRDWCISRQIWWGHQIPAWTCDACGEVIVEMEARDLSQEPP